MTEILAEGAALSDVKTPFTCTPRLNPHITMQDYQQRSLRNRRNFLRISGEQRQKRGEREARVACEGRIFLALLPSHTTRASRSSRFRLCSPEIRKKITPALQAINNVRL